VGGAEFGPIQVAFHPRLGYPYLDAEVGLLSLLYAAPRGQVTWV